MAARRDKALAALPVAIDAAIAEADANPDPEDAWRQMEGISAALEAARPRVASLRQRVAARWYEEATRAAEANGGVFHLAELGRKIGVSKARAGLLVKSGREQDDALSPGDQSGTSA